MEFKEYLAAQLTAHPSAKPQDVVKMCYQAACGAEHLLSDLTGAQRYFREEFASVDAKDIPLEEPISDNVSRVNLAAWKAAGLPPEWLFRLFAASASSARIPDEKTELSRLLAEADSAMPRLPCGFTADEWTSFLQKYREAGMPALHHSSAYRTAEASAYRIVNRRLLRILPILSKIQSCGIPEKRPLIIAIDGRAASGKSTAADILHEVTGAAVIRMDDFFLPPPMRTPERFAAPGGNVHHERFAEEVLPRLAQYAPFTYRIFDCSIMALHGERQVDSAPIRVVEGSYSTHPALGRYADITVFSDIEPSEQMDRIRLRNGEALAQRFQNEWIPMEESYFDTYSIREKADISL
ncbi:MAG: hypothetical protein E7662_07975 [Ruminococcaceae bacterium]|nr:hypothetical protein [Oscillospiraceae bacterium]